MTKKRVKCIVVIWVLIHFILSSTSGLWQSVVWARDESVGELIEFQAYFQEKDQVKSKLLIERDNELVVRLALPRQGILNDLVLQLKQANFRIKADQVKDSRIQEIKEDTGEIVLAPISSGSTVELVLPIEFKQQNLVESDYFLQEAVFLIKGNYKQDEKIMQAVNQELSVALQWTSETSLQASEEVEKYLSVLGRGVLLQTKLTAEVLGNCLPKEQESLSIQTVSLRKQYPKEIVVLVNGKKQLQGVQYQADTGMLTIDHTLSSTNTSTIIWGEGRDCYQILAYYDSSVGTSQTTISLSTSLQTKLFTQPVQTQTLERQVTIKPMGNVVDLSLSSTPEVVKGYMYAKSEKETSYEQKEKISISDVTQLGSITLSEGNPSFTNNQNMKVTASSSVYYQNTKIQAESLKTILGQNGKLSIQQPDGTIITELTSTSPVQEQGNYVISYEGTRVNNLQFIFTDLAQEGEIVLKHQKAISGNTGYEVSTLKKAEQLVQKITANTSLGKESKDITIALRDTEPKAELSISQEQWQTLQTNEHMTIDFTFLSDDPSQDLYRNPTLAIELPTGIEEITVNSINKAHSDEFEITKAGMITNEQGKRILQVKLQGMQTKYHDTFTKGLSISFDVTVRLKKDIPSHEEEIVAHYTNENRSGQTFEIRKSIQLVSKFGALVYTKVQGYNEAGETKEATNGMIQTAYLDSKQEERKASADIILMNNYAYSLEKVSLIGTLPGKDKTSIGDKTLESTEDNLTLLSVTSQEQGITIWYSPEAKPAKESQSWTQNPEGAKSFKLELPNNELTPTQVVHLHIEFMIHTNMDHLQKAYLKVEEEYQYEGKQATAYSAIQFVASGQEADISVGNELPESEMSQTINGLLLQTKVTSNGKGLQEGASVYEGQTITYQLKVTNQTGNEMKNVKLVANHTNSVFYGYVEKQIIATEGEEDYITEIRYEEDETIKQKEMSIDLLKPNETITETYEFTVRLRDENQEQTQGNLQIQADNWENKIVPLMSHPIESAELKATLNFTLGVDKFLETRTTVAFGVTVENLTEEAQKAIVVLPFPEWMTYNAENMDPEYQLISTDDHQLQVKVEGIPAKAKTAFTVFFDLHDFPSDQKETELSLRAKVSTETGKQYESNTITKTVKASSKGLQLTLASNVRQEPLVHEQGVVFTGTIENLDDKSYSDIEVSYQIPDGFLVQKAYWYLPEGEKQEIVFEEAQNISFTLNEIPAKAKLEFVLEGLIDCTFLSVGQTEITGYFTTYTNGVDYSSNRLVYEVKPIEPEEPEEPDEPDVPDIPNIPDDPEVGTHQISGMAWIDANKNGVKDRNENPFKQVNVLLLSIDEQGEITTKQKTQTDETGYYEFTSLPEGHYVVGFAYDTTKYRMTQYQKEGIHESLNSDAFSQKKYDNQMYAVTDTLSITQEDLANLDAGFIPNEIFDLRLDKTITQVVVQYPSGVKVYQYNQAQLAKVEIDAKKINQASVVIEYQIKVTNEGELTGYVNDIVDYLPADFKFSSELNKDWYSGQEGKLHNVSLSNEPIDPGSTKTVSLTLTKTINDNNVGLTVNTAELERTSNDMSFADIDSVAGNHKQGEDDISSAELIISVKTGLVVAISTGIILGLFLLAAFVIWQLKRREDHEKRNTQD